MAAKPQNGENTQGGQSKGQALKHLEQIEQLCKKHKIKVAVYAGACALHGWKPGKVLTEKEFLDGITAFNQMPINHSPGKESEGR